jgi:hypothetical protein
MPVKSHLHTWYSPVKLPACSCQVCAGTGSVDRRSRSYARAVCYCCKSLNFHHPLKTEPSMHHIICKMLTTLESTCSNPVQARRQLPRFVRCRCNTSASSLADFTCSHLPHHHSSAPHSGFLDWSHSSVRAALCIMVQKGPPLRSPFVKPFCRLRPAERQPSAMQRAGAGFGGCPRVRWGLGKGGHAWGCDAVRQRHSSIFKSDTAAAREKHLAAGRGIQSACVLGWTSRKGPCARQSCCASSEKSAGL